MNSPASTFNTAVHGKWILAGEHAVLRGKPALVFPVPDRFVSLSFSPEPPHTEDGKLFDVEFTGPYGETLLLVFWGLIEEGLKLIGKSHKNPQEYLKGKVSLNNTIPMGAGMGFSAALCVAMGRWFCAMGWLNEDSLFQFARDLEDFFHSKSSGVDIAGALYNQGACFTRANKPILEPLQPAWHPIFYLSHSTEISVTSQCIKIVETLWQENQRLGQEIDQQMHDAVIMAKQALLNKNEDALDQLAEAINQAKRCFEQWGLVKGGLKAHMDILKSAGALAVKPTGAGNGGYVLSLWAHQPPEMGFEMIRV